MQARERTLISETKVLLFEPCGGPCTFNANRPKSCGGSFAMSGAMFAFENFKVTIRKRGG